MGQGGQGDRAADQLEAADYATVWLMRPTSLRISVLRRISLRTFVAGAALGNMTLLHHHNEEEL